MELFHAEIQPLATPGNLSSAEVGVYNIPCKFQIDCIHTS